MNFDDFTRICIVTSFAILLMCALCEIRREERNLLLATGASPEGMQMLESMRQTVENGYHPDNGYDSRNLYPPLRYTRTIDLVTERAEEYLSMLYAMSEEEEE